MLIAVDAFQSIGRFPERLQSYFREQVSKEIEFCFQSEFSIRTVGLPIYKAESEDVYLKNADMCRAIFKARYLAVYEFVIDQISNALNASVTITEHLAPPGFHVITATGSRSFWGGKWHVDRFPNWKNVVNPFYTFTMVLGDNCTCFTTDFCNDEKEDACERIQHHSGRLTVFPSAARHRIGGFSTESAKLERITLQGHLAKSNNGFELFW